MERQGEAARGEGGERQRREAHPPSAIRRPANSDQRPATSDQPVSMYRRYGRYLTHGLITILLFLLFPSILIFFFPSRFLFPFVSVRAEVTVSGQICTVPPSC